MTAHAQFNLNKVRIDMNRLPIEERAQIIGLLVEGMSMRAITRIIGCSINTVTKLLEEVGFSCAMDHSEYVRNINSKRVQADEIWAFCSSKERNVAPENKGVLGHGDVYTWTAMDADSKLMISYLVGQRTPDDAKRFVLDTASRVAGRVQLTTDGHKAYFEAVADAFHGKVDYAQLVKLYGDMPPDDVRKSSLSKFQGARKGVVSGNPAKEHISTSFVERQSLTMRMGMRRFTRLTNGFSKKIENLDHAVSLHFLHYNFARIHKTLRVTPAMEAGISDHVWTLQEIAELAS